MREDQRPYFFWDYDITEEQIGEILRGDNEVEKAWVITRILEYARWEDIWRYLSVADVRENFDGTLALSTGRGPSRRGSSWTPWTTSSLTRSLPSFGRADIKDFVDLYFILQMGYDFYDLFARAREKDLGLTEFYFVGMLRQLDQHTQLPKMVKPLELETLQTFYASLAQRLMSRLNPER
jgi:hypothetical protein